MWPFNKRENKSTVTSKVLFGMLGSARWSGRRYTDFSNEGYIQNAVAFRCINLISKGAASVDWQLKKSNGSIITEHKLLDLLHRPNPVEGGAAFFEKIFSYYLISGNCYIHNPNEGGKPKELYTLRPDRIEVITSKSVMPTGYKYTVDGVVTKFPIDILTGKSQILHWKSFNPIDDWYGLSPIEAAAYSIDQHNQAGAWNQSLLQNGARPSGALVVKTDNDTDGSLSDDQYTRLKSQMDEQYSGAANAGRPMLLEGGLDWKEMSLSPKDMDFINSKHTSARDIALAFGVPPQLLGIPGDNTYSNLEEARLALWEQTILPMLDNLVDEINNWLTPLYGDGIKLSYDMDSIDALSPRRQKRWENIANADFLTIDEKREAIGKEPKDGGDVILVDFGKVPLDQVGQQSEI